MKILSWKTTTLQYSNQKLTTKMVATDSAPFTPLPGSTGSEPRPGNATCEAPSPRPVRNFSPPSASVRGWKWCPRHGSGTMSACQFCQWKQPLTKWRPSQQNLTTQDLRENPGQRSKFIRNGRGSAFEHTFFAPLYNSCQGVFQENLLLILANLGLGGGTGVSFGWSQSKQHSFPWRFSVAADVSYRLVGA